MVRGAKVFVFPLLLPACLGYAPTTVLPSSFTTANLGWSPVSARRPLSWTLPTGTVLSDGPRGRVHIWTKADAGGTASPKPRIYTARSLSVQQQRLSMTSCDVCVVGSINYDQVAYVGSPPKPGQTIHGKKYTTGFGGKGANQCVMAAKMGAKAAMVGALGNDEIAKITRENMKSVGVKIDGIAEKKGVSSVAQIVVSDDGQNSIIICPGANLELIPYDLDPNTEEITGCKVLLLQNEIAPRVTLAAMYRAQEASPSPLVILNAAPAPSIGDKWEEGEWYNMEQMVGACDILCVNESEAEKISGLSLEGGAAGQEGSLRELASKILSMGAKQVLFTLGSEGSCLVSAGAAGAMDPASLTLCRVQGCKNPVEVVDTSGAGDAFLGAFAAYVAAGRTPEEALPLAGEVATLTVQKNGAQSSYPDGRVLPEHLRLQRAEQAAS